MPAAKTALWVLSLCCGGLTVSHVVLWTRLGRLESADAGAPRSLAHEPLVSASARTAPSTALEAAAAAAQAAPELAPYMGELLRLTHKLQLSLAANNHRLAEFYLYESREVVREISHAVPEYRGQPIAILVERTLQPAYAAVARALARKDNGALLQESFGKVIAACNACHQITNHAIIRVAEVTPSKSPYLQVFEPSEEHVAHQIE